LAAALGAFFCSQAEAQLSCCPSACGRVAWWAADGNAQDSLGVHDGTLVGGVGFAAGRHGLAFDLDGVDDRVDMGTAELIGNGTDPFTVSIWVHLASAPPTGKYIFLARFRHQTQFQLAMTREFQTSGSYIATSFRQTSHQWWRPIDFATFVGHWVHVAAVYTGGPHDDISSLRVYVDGQEVPIGTPDLGGVGGTVNDNGLGWDANPHPENVMLHGRIDDVHLFDRALTPAEIAAVALLDSTHDIAAAPSPGGTILPSGTASVLCGSSQTFHIDPNQGSRIDDVRVDGGSVGAVSSYTFSNVTSAHTIEARFAYDATRVGEGWEADGALVANSGGSETEREIVADGAGGWFVTWASNRAGPYSVYAQRLDAAGVPMWSPNGVLVLSRAGRDITPDAIASDGAGGFIVFGMDRPTGSPDGKDLCAQRVDAQGTSLWGSTGVTVCDASGEQDYPMAVPDGKGGAILTWTDLRTPANAHDIYAQRVDASGTPKWTANGVAICDATGTQIKSEVLADGAAGAYFVWDDARAGDPNQDIYAQRVDSLGVRYWAGNGIAVCTAANIQSASRISSDGSGGMVAVWQDLRSGVTGRDVFAQRIDPAGNPQWAANGKVVCDVAGNQGEPWPAPDGVGGTIVAWTDGQGSGNENIYVQKLDASGQQSWASRGIPLCDTTGAQYSPVLVPDGAGGAVAVWTDRRGGLYDLFARRVNAAGSAQWAAHGVPATMAGGAANAMVATSDGRGGLVVAWNDQRSGGLDLYVQRVTAGGGSGFDFDLAASAGANGTVTPAGTSGVWAGSAQDLEITPTSGFEVQNVSVDGQSIGAVTGYTFFAIDADHTLSATFTNQPSISGIEPDQGADDGAVTAVVAGVGFLSGATVELVRSGETDIVGTQPVVAPDGRSVAATFDLAGAAQGTWDVVVTNPNATGATLPASFAIAGGAPQQLRVDILGPALIRPNRTKSFDIVIENLGNRDVVALPLWISGIPTGATVGLDFAPTPLSGCSPDSIPPITLAVPSGRYLPLVIPRVPPGVTVRTIQLTVPPSASGTLFDLDAAVTPPWTRDPGFLSCLARSGVIQDSACVGLELEALVDSLAEAAGIRAVSGVAVWSRIACRCEGAATPSAGLVIAQRVLELMLQAIQQGIESASCTDRLRPRWQGAHSVAVVNSVDPNDKFGTNGFGPNRQIGSRQFLPYTIRFENLENASASAQEVVVLDALDMTRFDLDSTFSLGEIKFGRNPDTGLPWIVSPPPGLSSYTTCVDLRPHSNLIVRVAVNLDRATGVLGWSLTSIDPATVPAASLCHLGQPVSDTSVVGFLPPNVTPPQGEGSLFFSVRPRANLANGSPIRNHATIYFDGIPTVTPEWSNTLDTTAPESQILPLGPFADSASFTVQWAASGTPLDLRDYSVYVSESGGAYRPWRLNTIATADTFVGPGNRSYSFYSLARDSSGNLEAVPGAPDAQTFSRADVGDARAWTLALEGARPHPAVGKVRVFFTLPSRERATLEVMDVAGRRLVRREVGALGPGRHSVDLTAAVRRPGMYFLRLTHSSRTLNRRMVVIH
jgi:hypothetical protein